jgi:hypothetical protein
MDALREVLQEYSKPVVLGGAKVGKAKTGEIDKEALQKALMRLSQKNEKYFIIGMIMAVVLFVALIVVAFIQLGQPNSIKAVPPIFGSSAALVVWRMFRTWREKNYTDCILALVPNVDDETLKTIVGVLVKKI